MHFVKIGKIRDMQIRTGCFPNPVFLMTQYTYTVYYFSVECYDRPRGSDLRTRISLTYRNDINKNQEYISGRHDTWKFPTVFTFSLGLGKSCSNAIQKSKVFTLAKKYGYFCTISKDLYNKPSESRTIN